MSIQLKTHKLLWGRSGNRCAYPGCRLELVFDETESDDPSIIGEEAHIVARKLDGPRGRTSLPSEKRDLYDNLILLCRTHHKLVDDQFTTHTVARLLEFKAAHEEWVSETLSLDSNKLKDDLMYAGYIDKLCSLIELFNWRAWTSEIFHGGQPHIRQKYLVRLEEASKYILSRIWPRRYHDLECAFENFRIVSDDFRQVFKMHINQRDPARHESNDDAEYEMRWTTKFYRIKYWDTALYNQLAQEYDFHHLLIEDLALEMTRALNRIIVVVRRYIHSTFRSTEGVLLVVIGPFSDLTYLTVRTEYTLEQSNYCSIYKGIEDFMLSRATRDSVRGQGVSDKYKQFA